MSTWFTLYFLPFLIAFAVSFSLTPFIRKFAISHGLVRPVRPNHAQDIHGHKNPVPLFGGAVIFISFFVLLGYYAFFTSYLSRGFLLPKHLLGIVFAGVVLFFGGYLDDRYEIAAKHQWIAPFVATLIIIASGIGINFITNPVGETFRLDTISFTVFETGGLPYKVVLLADIFTLLWMMGMTYTIKFVDGVDGLSTSINFIGFLIIFFLSITKTVSQPETAFLAVVMAGAILGFWPYHMPRAKSFVGEGGVMFMGFMLGLLAIISGGKIATALLVMGVPIIDTARVIITRMIKGKSPFKGDDTHLHHLLLKLGLKQWQVVLIICIPSMIFGGLAVALQGFEKLMALFILFIIMIVFVTILGVLLSKRAQKLKSID